MKGGNEMKIENNMVTMTIDEYNRLSAKKDEEVSIEEFLKRYHEELGGFFEDMDEGKESERHIYGYNFTVHWNGIFCDCSDGATPFNYLIPALDEVKEEIDEWG